MVQEQTKNTFGLNFTYEMTDELVKRASRMLLCRWSSFFDQMQDNESFLLSRLKQISTYAEQVRGDDYLSNLWWVWIGSRNEGVPVITALKRMEKVRRVLEQNKIEVGQPKIPDIFVPEIIHEVQPTTKMKHLLRFGIAQQLSTEIYSKLLQLQTKPGLCSDLSLAGHPYMFADKLKQLLLALK
jgi:hypothetical protein